MPSAPRAARHLLAAFGLALSVLAAPPAAAAAPDLPRATGLELTAEDRRAELRLTIEATGGAPLDWDAYLVDAPPRLVLDLPRLDWRVEPPATGGLLRSLRWGLGTPTRARLVAELAGPARLETLAEAVPGDDALRLTLRLQAAEAFDAPGLLPARADRRKPLVVALDPGHGGRDPGAMAEGMREKELTLAVARVTAAALRERGFTPILTRGDDSFVSLSARVARARAAGADLLISLHADSLAAGVATGASVYIQSDKPSGPAAAAFAARENAAFAPLAGGGALAVAGSDVAAALVALAEPRAAAASRRLGRRLVESLSRRGPVMATKPLREADFRVLAAPEIPAALVELGFLSTPEDRERLLDPRWRAAAAEAMAEAVAAWAQDEASAR